MIGKDFLQKYAPVQLSADSIPNISDNPAIGLSTIIDNRM